ncbi:MAG: pirin family protein [Litorivicinus sp.]
MRRQLVKVVKGMPTSDGAGVKLKRVIGQPSMPDLDPFMLLDDFRNNDPKAYGAGFPPHPHRGFETVTYMIEGQMEHQDSAGNRGLLRDGGVQWMTAGAGILHSEMPKQTDGRMWGFQLWVNLPSHQKMVPPGYQDIQSADIPEVVGKGYRVRVIAGEFEGQAGAAKTLTDVSYLDVHIDGGQRVQVDLKGQEHAVVFAYDGQTKVSTDESEAETVSDGDAAILKGEGAITLYSRNDARVLVIAGAPLNEPVARHGPFVMNTHDELVQAVEDYNAGKLAPNQWEFLGRQ